MLKDPALRKVFEESDDFGFRKHATAYAADVYTKIDVSDVTAGATVIGVFTSPPQFSEDQLRQKIKEVMDNITDQSIQNLFSYYSVVDPSLFLNSSLQSDVQNDYQWMQNDAVEKHLLALGFPAPKPLVVVRCETQVLRIHLTRGCSESHLPAFESREGGWLAIFLIPRVVLNFVSRFLNIQKSRGWQRNSFGILASTETVTASQRAVASLEMSRQNSTTIEWSRVFADEVYL